MVSGGFLTALSPALRRQLHTRAVLRWPVGVEQVVLESPWLDLLVMTVMFIVCFVAGTALFVRHERNR